MRRCLGGSLPFILGLLYFWADMSRSPFARQHLTGAALGLALVFLWMKFWQTIFANQLRAQLCSLPAPRWSAGKCWRILLIQTAVHPSGLFLLPLESERYGERGGGPLAERRAVPLAEVLDEEAGIGFDSGPGYGAEPSPLLEGLM